jgi:hypothetical protein
VVSFDSSAATVADEGLEGGNLAKKLDGYQELVTECTGTIKETIDMKDD